MVVLETDPSICIIGLRFFIDLAIFPPSMDHAGVHGYGLCQYVFKKSLASGLPHRVDASFGERKVDRFGKIQGGC